MKIIPLSFYQNETTLEIAKALIGKVLVSCFNNSITSGRIVETEAYLGIEDKASHAFGGKRTRRTETMYLPGGHAYVYLCYGIHHLFNIVTNKKDVPDAILIRALEPMEGIPVMLARRNKNKADLNLTRGPGSLAKALGINKSANGLPLSTNKLYVADDGFSVDSDLIAEGPRIGVGYAGAHAMLPYRFFIKKHPFVSG